MKPTVRLLILGAILGAGACLLSTAVNCATTKSVVAIAKTCADNITNDVETSVFSALNEATDLGFVDSLEKVVAKFTECVVGAEIDRVIASFSVVPVDAGTTVEVIKARKSRLSDTEQSVVFKRAVAWRTAHPAAPTQ